MALLEISKPRHEPAINTIAVRLQSIHQATSEVLLFELKALEGLLPTAAAGSHIDVHLPSNSGVTSRRGIRQYSLLQPLCTSNTYVIGVKKELNGQGGSLWLHTYAHIGMELEISFPRNNFELDETAPDTLLIAGGIGITPIYSMFERLQELGRPVRMLYSCRSSELVLFPNRLLSHPDVVMNYAAGPDAGPVANFMATAGPRTELYCCGPGGMLNGCTELAERLSITRLHIERFAAEAPPDIGQVPDTNFSVSLARTGVEIQVCAGQSILEALIAANIDVPYSCEEGICGACETKVLSGSPCHRDSLRTPAEHDRMGTVMICCARSRSDQLVLDI